MYLEITILLALTSICSYYVWRAYYIFFFGESSVGEIVSYKTGYRKGIRFYIPKIKFKDSFNNNNQAFAPINYIWKRNNKKVKVYYIIDNPYNIETSFSLFAYALLYSCILLPTILFLFDTIISF
jgi:hypothetical protein